MTLHSALFEGWVRHRRMSPRRHEFMMPLFMVYLDLSEIDAFFAPFRRGFLWSAEQPAIVRFRREDYLADEDGGHDVPLDVAVRRRVAAKTGREPRGPIRMLTHLRTFGHIFNPVSFYYCFDATDTRVETIVAEITNTPWKERHAYVLSTSRAAGAGESRDGRGDAARFRFDKVFHVSPFMPMDLAYDWTFVSPPRRDGERLDVHMNLNERDGSKVFDATLRLTRREASVANMRRVLWQYPLMTARVVARIHAEALRLWLKRVPVWAHPGSLVAGGVR